MNRKTFTVCTAFAILLAVSVMPVALAHSTISGAIEPVPTKVAPSRATASVTSGSIASETEITKPVVEGYVSSLKSAAGVTTGSSFTFPVIAYYGEAESASKEKLSFFALQTRIIDRVNGKLELKDEEVVARFTIGDQIIVGKGTFVELEIVSVDDSVTVDEELNVIAQQIDSDEIASFSFVSPPSIEINGETYEITDVSRKPFKEETTKIDSAVNPTISFPGVKTTNKDSASLTNPALKDSAEQLDGEEIPSEVQEESKPSFNIVKWFTRLFSRS